MTQPIHNSNTVVVGAPVAAPVGPVRSVGVAYALWFLLGLVGGHKFYLGKAGMGVAYLVTLGFFGVGWIIDAFTLPAQVRDSNRLRGFYR